MRQLLGLGLGLGLGRRVPLAAGALLISTAACSADDSPPASSSPGGQAAAAPGGQAAAAPEKGVPKDTSEKSDTSTTPPSTTAAACTGDPGTFYALNVQKLDSTEKVPLCTYKDTVVLVVNGASHCGYTPQYEPLEKLYTKYATDAHQKFEILAFPSDSFNQESDTDAEVSSFCTTKYNITFPLATIAPVIDDATKKVSAQPVYKWLYAQPGMDKPVAWNFEKFLIGKDGKVAKRFLTAVSPDEGGEIDKAIAAELAK